MKRPLMITATAALLVFAAQSPAIAAESVGLTSAADSATCRITATYSWSGYRGQVSAYVLLYSGASQAWDVDHPVRVDGLSGKSGTLRLAWQATPISDPFAPGPFVIEAELLAKKSGAHVAGTGIAIGSSIIQSYTDVVGCGLPAPAI